MGQRRWLSQDTIESAKDVSDATRESDAKQTSLERLFLSAFYREGKKLGLAPVEANNHFIRSLSWTVTAE